MTKILNKYGLKNTACRQAILDILSKSHQPIAAETIRQKLKNRYNLVTIYRNLSAFEQKGMIFKENINRIDCYYMDDAQHHHVVCNNCGKMECIPCTHDQLKIKNFINVKHQLVLTGTCQKCFKG